MKSNKYQDWYASQVSKQLERGVEPHNIKVNVTLTKLKPLHAGQVINYHKKMQSSASVVKNGFRKAKIFEFSKEADALINLDENLFVEIVVKQQTFKQTR